MTKYIKYVTRAIQVGALVAGKIPAILADGKITAQEAFELLVAIFEICGWSIEFHLPDSMKSEIVTAKVI